jgi:hypothetical protein
LPRADHPAASLSYANRRRTEIDRMFIPNRISLVSITPALGADETAERA